MVARALAWALCVVPVACAGGGDRIEAADRPADWKQVVSPSDMKRIQSWRSAFVDALAQARARGQSAAIDREGNLLQPDAALGPPGPMPGDYTCRVIKIGAKSPGMLPFVAYPAFSCRVDDEGGVMSFAKVSGSQRPVGLIFKGDGLRQIFLGTMMLGDETRALEYGRDTTRDMAGAVERIGDRRWRLILPYPHFESMMDVVELVPANA